MNKQEAHQSTLVLDDPDLLLLSVTARIHVAGVYKLDVLTS
jgi:hypothetical protein